MKKRSIRTKSLVAASLLTAISIILTRVFSVIIPIAGGQGLRIGFGGVPIMISGILFGPLVGALTGTTADLIGVLINPMGPYFPGFTLSAALSGFIPGLFYHYIFKNKEPKRKNINYTIINALIVILISLVSAYIYIQAGNSISYQFLIVYIVGMLGFIALPIFINRKYKNGNSIYRFDRLIFVVSIRTIIISIFLNTLWLIMLYNLGFIVIFPFRLLSALVTIPLDAIIIYTLSKYFKYVD
ncbi:MAG: folate family ECF transporter S component [Senegalia sp. (in: firmicutes)]|uniref:folate family ECF transporter S component n=1 Tax=Senegalia sp. (in: firmicutes) TaxID=1924098 RepID=UPI003F99DC0B